MSSLRVTTFLLVTGLLTLSQTGQQKGAPKASSSLPLRIFRTDPARYLDAVKAHSGAGSLRYMILVDGSIFNTNLLFIHRGVLAPHSSIGHHIHRQIEEMYVIFDNRARFTVNGRTSELGAGVMVPCLMGSSHGIYNPTDRETQWMNIGVAAVKGKYDAEDLKDDLVNTRLDPQPQFALEWIDRKLLKPMMNVHKGKGTLLFRRIWSHETFKSNWGFIDHVVVPGGSSIGYHRHDLHEECYLILAGRGRVTVDGETAEVGPGDAIPCLLHQSHGIYNHTDQDLELLNIAVSREKGKFDSTDLGNDLTLSNP